MTASIFHLLVGPIFSVLITLLGAAFIWGKIQERMDQYRKDIDMLKGGLYRRDGTLVYVTREECMKSHEGFKLDMGSQIQEVKTLIAEIQNEFQEQSKYHNTELQKITKFMGRVEQALAMKNND